MKGIILAAGRGSRMKALTDDRPKCLVELSGRPLLNWQVNAFHAAGIDEIAIVTGYKHHLLAEFGLIEFHNSRWAETNMVSSLACANAWLESDSCIVSYSDIFYKPSAVQSLLKASAPLAITYDPNWLDLWGRRFENPLVDAEAFKLRPDSTLAEIGRPATSISEIEGQYMGLLRFTPKGWGELARIRSMMSSSYCDALDMTGALQRIVDENRIPIQAIPYEQHWGEVDSGSDLNLYKEVYPDGVN